MRKDDQNNYLKDNNLYVKTIKIIIWKIIIYA